jgi:hypothetical protein
MGNQYSARQKISKKQSNSNTCETDWDHIFKNCNFGKLPQFRNIRHSTDARNYSTNTRPQGTYSKYADKCMLSTNDSELVAKYFPNNPYSSQGLSCSKNSKYKIGEDIVSAIDFKPSWETSFWNKTPNKRMPQEVLSQIGATKRNIIDMYKRYSHNVDFNAEFFPIMKVVFQSHLNLPLDKVFMQYVVTQHGPHDIDIDRLVKYHFQNLKALENLKKSFMELQTDMEIFVKVYKITPQGSVGENSSTPAGM